jgi:ketosteroid isomerase-like protein
MTTETRNREAIEAFRQALEAQDMSALGQFVNEYAADDFVEEWPQSGERIRGKDAMARMNEQYEGATGTSPKMTLRRILSEGDLGVVEGTIDYGDGTPVSYVGIAEFRDGKVGRLTEYFANPFEAPEWRRPFVERMD